MSKFKIRNAATDLTDEQQCHLLFEMWRPAHWQVLSSAEDMGNIESSLVYSSFLITFSPTVLTEHILKGILDDAMLFLLLNY